MRNLVALASALVLGSGALSAAFAHDSAAMPDSPADIDVVMISDGGPGMHVPPPEMFITAMHGGRPGMCPFQGREAGQDVECLVTDLSLTDEQYEKMFQAKQDFMTRAGAKIMELRTQSMELKSLMCQPEIDKAKIVATQNKVNQLNAEIANLGLEKKLACLSALTAEQRKEIRHRFLSESCKGWNCPVKPMRPWKHKMEMSR